MVKLQHYRGAFCFLGDYKPRINDCTSQTCTCKTYSYYGKWLCIGVVRLVFNDPIADEPTVEMLDIKMKKNSKHWPCLRKR